jgi:hypothetical protein
MKHGIEKQHGEGRANGPNGVVQDETLEEKCGFLRVAGSKSRLPHGLEARPETKSLH